MLLLNVPLENFDPAQTYLGSLVKPTLESISAQFAHFQLQLASTPQFVKKRSNILGPGCGSVVEGKLPIVAAVY